jgi:contractile injection system tube protein
MMSFGMVAALAAASSGAPMTLIKAQIQPEKGSPIDCLFNPDKITYTKTNGWTHQATNGTNLPRGAFSGGQPATLVLKLILDTTESGGNVAHIVDELIKLTKIDDTLRNGTAPGTRGGANKSPVHRPPTCTFVWGSYLSFTAVIATLVVDFTLFLGDGTPIRAEATVTFKQIADADAFPKQNPTSGGRTGERIHRLGPGETLDQVAYEAFGQTGLWRALAAYNSIDDPLRLHAGDALLLPASADDLKGFG